MEVSQEGYVNNVATLFIFSFINSKHVLKIVLSLRSPGRPVAERSPNLKYPLEYSVFNWLLLLISIDLLIIMVPRVPLQYTSLKGGSTPKIRHHVNCKMQL